MKRILIATCLLFTVHPATAQYMNVNRIQTPVLHLEHATTSIPPDQLFWLNQSSQHYMPAGAGNQFRSCDIAPAPWGVFLVGLAAGICGDQTGVTGIMNHPLSIGQGDHLPLIAKPDGDK